MLSSSIGADLRQWADTVCENLFPYFELPDLFSCIKFHFAFLL